MACIQVQKVLKIFSELFLYAKLLKFSCSLNGTGGKVCKRRGTLFILWLCLKNSLHDVYLDEKEISQYHQQSSSPFTNPWQGGLLLIISALILSVWSDSKIPDIWVQVLLSVTCWQSIVVNFVLCQNLLFEPNDLIDPTDCNTKNHLYLNIAMKMSYCFQA